MSAVTYRHVVVPTAIEQAAMCSVLKASFREDDYDAAVVQDSLARCQSIAAFHGDIMVGVGLIDVGTFSPASAEIELMGVLPDYQRTQHRVGLNMLALAERLAADAGYTAITVTSFAESVEFYENHGYRPVGPDDYYTFSKPL